MEIDPYELYEESVIAYNQLDEEKSPMTSYVATNSIITFKNVFSNGTVHKGKNTNNHTSVKIDSDKIEEQIAPIFDKYNEAETINIEIWDSNYSGYDLDQPLYSFGNPSYKHQFNVKEDSDKFVPAIIDVLDHLGFDYTMKDGLPDLKAGQSYSKALDEKIISLPKMLTENYDDLSFKIQAPSKGDKNYGFLVTHDKENDKKEFTTKLYVFTSANTRLGAINEELVTPVIQDLLNIGFDFSGDWEVSFLDYS